MHICNILGKVKVYVGTSVGREEVGEDGEDDSYVCILEIEL